MLAANQAQEGAKENVFIKKPWKIFFFEAFLFATSLTIGIITAFQFNKVAQIQKMVVPEVSLERFIFSFIIATLFFFLLIKFLKFNKKKKIIFKIIFTLSIFFGGTLLLSVWVSEGTSLFLMTLLIFWWWWKPSILVQDLCIVLGIAGVGSFLGLALRPETVVILLVVFSIYDFVAVYKTKHMVKMAKEMIASQAILGLVVPSHIGGFGESLAQVKPGGKFLVLGGGDIVFPLLLAAALVPEGIFNSLIIAILSLVGLLMSFLIFISQKKRKAIPALPPIALLAIIGFLIVRLLR